MSISAAGLKLESQATSATVVWKKPSGKIQDLSNDCYLHHLFGFLNPSELALAERVNRSWRAMINPEDQHAWKDQCYNQSISVVSPLIEGALSSYSSKNVTGKFDARTLALITEYEDAGVRYKEHASVIQGEVELVSSYHYLSMRDKGNLGQLRWGSDAPELFISTQTYSDESMAACEAHHKPKCKKLGAQGSWQDIHPRILKFPGDLPLRFFIHRDGSYKQAGDKIKLRYQNKAVILTCVFNHDYRDNTPLTSFAEGVASRIMTSVECSFITPAHVDQAKAAARLSGEWISSD